MEQQFGPVVEKFKITYLDYASKKRKNYMPAFDTQEQADTELNRLKNEQKSLVKRGSKITKGYFKVKPIKVRPVIRQESMT